MDTSKLQHWDGVSGPTYVNSYENLEREQRIGAAVLPYARLLWIGTEYAIHGSLADDNKLYQNRNIAGEIVAVPKVRTMHHIEPGQTMDIDVNSPRIINRRARMARKLAFDEMPQWALAEQGIMSVTGPRPMLEACKDNIAEKAMQFGLPYAQVNGWRKYIDTTRSGIISTSAARRRKQNLDISSIEGCVTTVLCDLLDRDNASPIYDTKIMAKCYGLVLYQGVRHIPQVLPRFVIKAT